MKVCATCGTEYADDQRFCPKDGAALRSTTPGSLVGSVIADRYHIVKKLGEGGMGAVYLGEHVKMGRKSAIKVMAPSMASDPEAMARFNREAANAARIAHPNVCAIYDFGETPDGVIYLAMEFIEGESLRDVLERERVLPPARALAILRQTADALQAAHDLSIVHRDLKPDNIMLARGRAGADVVKVVDFGIAKAMKADEGQQVTRTGLVVGTPEYMSPEQLSGDRLDGRSDVYSLALVVYRMLTGAFPFPADSAQEMMIKRLTDEPLPLARARPGLDAPAALQRVMDRALARMPGDRYPSAVEFAREVADAAAGWEGGAPAGDPEGATRIIGPVDATVPLAPTAVGARAQRPAPPPTTPTTPRPIPSRAPVPKRRPTLAVAAVAVLLVGGGATAALMLTDGGADDGPVARVDSGVTDDTARTGGGPRDSTSGGGAGRQTTTPAESTGSDPRPPIDVAAVEDELIRLGRAIESDATRTAAIARARALYARADLPAVLRARAASLAAEGYDAADDAREACGWIDRALTLDPGNQAFAQARNMLFGCVP